MTALPLLDNRAALEFLKKVYPDGRWVLTAIRPNPKSIETRTFGLANVRSAFARGASLSSRTEIGRSRHE
jgi:hypothetical protein